MDLRLIYSAMLKKAGGTPVKTGSPAAYTVPGSYEPGRTRPFVSDITRRAPQLGDDLNHIKRPLLHRLDDWGTGIADSIADWAIDKGKFVRDRVREFPKAAPELVKNPGQAGKAIVKGLSQTGNELVQGLTGLSKLPYTVGDAIGTKIQQNYPKFTDAVSSAMYPVGWLSNKKDEINEAHPWTRYVTKAPVIDPFSYDAPSLVEGANWLNDKAQYSNAMDTTGLSREADLLGRTTGGTANLVAQAFIPGFGMPGEVYKKGVTPWAFLSAMGKDTAMNAAFENGREFAGADRVDSDRKAKSLMEEAAKRRAEEYMAQKLYDDRMAANRGNYKDDADRSQGLKWAGDYVKANLFEAVRDGRITWKEANEILKDKDLVTWLSDMGSTHANQIVPGKGRQGWDYASELRDKYGFGDIYERYLDDYDARSQEAFDYANNPANWDERTIREMSDQFIKEMRESDLPELKQYTYNNRE